MRSRLTSSISVRRAVLTAATAALLALPAAGSASAASAAPECVGLMSNAAIARTMHVPRLSGPDWHLYGLPVSYCTYGPYPNELEVGVYAHGTMAEFRVDAQVKHGDTTRPVPQFGKHGVAIIDCTPGVGCDPTVVVLANDHLLYVNDQLGGANAASVSKVEALVRQLLAKV